MSLVGKTKIQLFDAKTGELEREVESSNMVTNAVKNILSPHLSVLFGESDNWDGFFSNISPIYKTLFGGIMIFGNRLEENANYIIPNQADRESLVGYGGQCSSLTGNNYRGDYNVSESTVLANGATHVWDFTTEQSNGVINSIALTSSWGGEAGWNTNNPDLAKTLIPVIAGNEMNTQLLADVDDRRVENAARYSYLSGNTSFYLHRFFMDGDNICFVGANYDSKVFKFYTKPLNSSASLLSKLSNRVGLPSSYTSYTASRTGEQYEGIAAGANRAVFYDVSGTTLYLMEVKLVNNVPTFSEYTYTLTGVSMRTSGYSDSEFVFVDDDYLYILTYNDKLLKIQRANTAVRSEIPLPSTLLSKYGTCLGMFQGSLFVADSNMDTSGRASIYLLNSDGVSWSRVPFATYGNDYNLHIYNNSLVKQPYCLVTRDNNKADDGSTYQCILSPYLATINNLDSPVVKTSSQTMKLTYTITNQ